MIRNCVFGLIVAAVVLGLFVAWLKPSGRSRENRSAGTSIQSPSKNAFREDRTLVRRWTMADFVADIDLSNASRDLQQGKAIFVASACIQCHQARDVGSELGPNLTAIGKRRSPRQILRDTIEPGVEISEGYQTQILITEDGEQVSGIVARENESTIWLAVDPLNDEQLTEIQKQNIDEQLTSPASPMPTGLLDRFSRDEILDLIAFLCSDLNR